MDNPKHELILECCGKPESECRCNTMWNHKGEYCIYTEKDSLQCIEGYCSECEIYHKFKEDCETLWGS